MERKSTNGGKGKPEQKFDAAFVNNFLNYCSKDMFQRSK
jgi:hypothetical protein